MISILFIDDEEIIRELIKQIFERAGHDITTTSSGDKALKIIKTKKFNLIISDFTMPGTHGLELIQLLAEKQKAPIIVVTGYAMGKDKKEIPDKEIIAKGAKMVLKKPLYKQTILDTIKYINNI